MQATYPLKIQEMRSKGKQPRFYVSFPLALAAAIGLEAVKPSNGNSLTVANSIWFGPTCPRQPPAAGPRQTHHKGPFQCRRAVS